MTSKVVNRRKTIQPLAFGVYFWAVAALTAVGLIDSIYLSISHYRIYTDIGYESFCAVSRSINCDTVSQSPYAVFLSLPVPVWGVIGYLFVLLLLVFAVAPSAHKKRVWALLFAVSLLYSAYGILLALISHIYIHSYCIMCILSYGINFMLLFYSWLIRRRFDSDRYLVSLRKDLLFLCRQRRLAASLMIPFVAGTIFLWVYFPAYWEIQTPIVSAELSTGITPEGYPWIGTESADLIITEFTDYLCFQCSKMHYYLRRLINRYPGKIKLIYRHFPMDYRVNPIVKKPLHEGSGALALMAIYAGTVEKFWPMNDYLFYFARLADQLDLNSVAEKIGIDNHTLIASMTNPLIRKKLRHDIADGISLGVSGTPTFLIEGNLYSGQIPADILERVIE